MSPDRSAGAGPLRAVSFPLDPDVTFDPMTLAGRDGVVFSTSASSFAGRGAALTLELGQGLDDARALAGVGRALEAVEHDDRTGWDIRVRAFGSLPFERRDRGSLTVAALTFGRTSEPDGTVRQWVTVVAPAPGPDESTLGEARALVAAADGAGPGRPGPALVALSPQPVPELYADAVAKVLTGIEGGAFSKVVLGRRLDVSFAEPLDTQAVLRRLRVAEPLCTLFAFPLEGGGRFLGATPELLVARAGRQVTCHPLAGTVGLGGEGDDEDALARFLASPKDQAEHRAVVDEIVATLTPRCTQLSAEAAPTLVRLHSVAHLGTRIEGTLAGSPPPDILGLLADLHPTPAVGGVPRGAALQCIEQLEPFARERWAGPVGWVDAAGDGRFMVGIRSAALSGSEARLWAGAGIVEGSQPEAELAETTVKLAPVLEALAPGTAARA